MNSQIDAAIKVLKEGGVILYPTDTIWGLGCDATNAEAVEKIYKIKQRSDSKSLITLASNIDMVCKYIKQMPEIAISLMEVNDKPMTIIYPGAIGLAKNVIAEDGTVGIRVPQSEFCIKLISRFHKPIVSTSANLSKEPSPECYDDISDDIMDAVDFIVDPDLEETSTHKASQIIKVGLRNEIEIIRE
ncbi:MAG: L-threonylcarbamoyladenylate synthase [Bacteroidales bacterium]